MFQATALIDKLYAFVQLSCVVMLLMYQQAVCDDMDKRMVLCPLLCCYRGSLFIALLFSFILYCQTIAKKLAIQLAKNQVRA
jgi:hypothetical protein